MDDEFSEFYKKACETFGEDKFTTKTIQVTDDNIKKFNEETGSSITREDVESYRAVWLLKPECPNCGESLSFTFSWGLYHGVGYCGSCKQVEFRLYHYIGRANKAVVAYSLVGFLPKDEE